MQSINAFQHLIFGILKTIKKDQHKLTEFWLGKKSESLPWLIISGYLLNNKCIVANKPVLHPYLGWYHSLFLKRRKIVKKGDF